MFSVSRVSLFVLFACVACSDGLEPEASYSEAEQGVNSAACTTTSVWPEVVTDGQRIDLPASTPANARIIFTGYRYNDAPPTRSLPQGEGREAIFCGCARASVESFRDPDGVPMTRAYANVPGEVPSGHYAVQVLPADGECPTVIDTAACPNVGCANPNFTVAPGYIVAKTTNIYVNDNSEPTGSHPSEMTLTWTGSSGNPSSLQDQGLVKWSGTFPGGPDGRNHFTNADNSNLVVELPLFVGPEHLMAAAECSEECKAKPSRHEAACLSQCQSYYNSGRFDNSLQFGVGGMEWDSSPSKGWGYAAGIGAAALTCAASIKLGVAKEGCAAGAGLGTQLSTAINDALRNDHDNLGALDVSTDVNARWNIGSSTRQRLSGQGAKGSVSLDYGTERVAAPRILSYSVSIKSVRLIEGHERSGGCDGADDVFLDARAQLVQRGQPFAGSQRFPDRGEWPMYPGNTKTFSPALQIGGSSFSAQNAPESPLVYVEIAAWENDGGSDRDLLGITAESIRIADYLGTVRNPSEGYTAEGYPTRSVKIRRSKTITGFASDEVRCGSGAIGWDPQAPRGKVRVDYDVDVTWLKSAPN